jgi:hypothetical protein
VDDIEEGAQAVHLVKLAGQGRGQVEPEPVHVHLLDPVAQAVHDELERSWMGHVQRVPTAGVVHVVARIVGHQPVVAGIVHPPETDRGPQVAPFPGVVIDHVQDHLDARLVQGLHQRLEFGDLLAQRTPA